MGARRAILGSVLLFVVVFAALTAAVAIGSGPSFLTLVSVLVLAVVGVGVGGALRHRPPSD